MNYSNNVFDSPGGAKSPFGSRNWNDTPLRKRKDIDGFTRPRGSLKHEYTPTFDSFGPTTPNAKNEGLFASSPNSKTTKQGNNDEQHHSPCKQKKKYNTLISTVAKRFGAFHWCAYMAIQAIRSNRHENQFAQKRL